MKPTNHTTLQNIFSDEKVVKVVDGFIFTEGPIWIPKGYLLFSDILASTIYKWSPSSLTLEIFRRPSWRANGLTLDKTGRLLACEHDGRVSRTEHNGEVVTLANSYNGKRLNSPNDIVVRSDGSIYFTDPPFGIINENQKELNFNGVFRVSPVGEITLLDDSFRGPNGLAFSPDEKTLYVNDSIDGYIRSFAVKENGLLGKSKLFAELINSDVEGVPDGMKVDYEGNVFCTGPGGIWVFNQTGTLLGILKIPEVPANLGWGGPNMKILYITAQTGIYQINCTTGGQK
jgi:gluconolactonase